MKKIIGIAVLGAILAGCGDRDEAYFFEHQDKAEAHLKACENKFMKAIEKEDEKALIALEKDPECNAAQEALAKQAQLDWEKEIAQRELARKVAEEKRLQAIAEEEAKRAQEIADMKATIVANNKDLSWEKRVSEFLKQDCKSGWGTPTAECAAWFEFYDEAVTEGKAALAQVDFEVLRGGSKEYCSLDQRSGSSCAVWQEALAEKGAKELEGAEIDVIEARKEEFCGDGLGNLAVCRDSWRSAWRIKNEALVKFFVDNDAEFITVYNSCVDQLDAVNAQNLRYAAKSEAKSRITDAAPCKQAANAYSNRGMGYSAFKVKIAE